MRKRSISAGSALLLATLLSVASIAQAQESGGVKVQGNTRIDANAKDVNTVATGSGNTAVTNIGVINSDTKGNTSVTVDVKNVDNVVGGHGRKGCVNIGSSSNRCQ